MLSGMEYIIHSCVFYSVKSPSYGYCKGIYMYLTAALFSWAPLCSYQSPERTNSLLFYFFYLLAVCTLFSMPKPLMQETFMDVKGREFCFTMASLHSTQSVTCGGNQCQRFNMTVLWQLQPTLPPQIHTHHTPPSTALSYFLLFLQGSTETTPCVSEK